MRVRFGELSPTEARVRERCRAQASQAWEHLTHGAAEQARALVTAMDPRLDLHVACHDAQVIGCVELSMSESKAGPLAQLLLEQAPADLGYTLALGRCAVPLADALRTTLAEQAVDLQRARVRAGFARGHLLEVTLTVPGGTGSEIEQIAAENLVVALLGERLFETWIGAVHVAAAPRGGPLRVLDAHAPKDALGLHELFDTVAAAARGVLQGLPNESRASQAASTVASSDQQADWVMLELEPLADASAIHKRDLVLTSTSTPELVRCHLDGSPCSSRRFSRVGEQFVFLSYADELVSAEARLARRAELEAKLSHTLQGVAVVTGVGLGVRTTYLDFALCNLETGLGRLVSNLRDVGAPPRSFIQFFDSELADEWLAIWPDSRLTAG